MPTPFGSFPFDAAGVDLFAHPLFINANRAPTINDIQNPGTEWMDSSVNPPIIYETSGAGNWDVGGIEPASTTRFGVVKLATLSELQNGNAPAGSVVPLSNDVATVIAGVVVGAVPPANTTQQGIVELATDAQVVTPFATDVPNTAVQPSNITAMFAAPEPIGSTTPNTGAFTNIAATGVGTGNVLTSNTASSIGVTGAGIDLTLSSASGRVVVNGEEAAADAVRILSAAGGLDVNTALQINIDSSQAAIDAIRIFSSNAAGGLDIDAGTGGATLDSTGVISVDAAGLINVTSTRANAQAILISTTAGGIDILATGTAGLDIDIIATGSSVNVTSTENAAEAIYLHANGGVLETVRIHADQGTGVASVNIGSDVGGITIAGGLGTPDAVNITAATAGGGIDIDASTGGIIVDTTGAISLDSAAASNFTVTGAFDLTLNSSAGSVVITGAEAAVDAVQINASNAAGGIDINAGTGGITIDSTGAFSIDGAAASNVTTTGAGIDLTLSSVLGSVLISSTEDAALAIRLHANGGTSETIQIFSDQGTGVASIGLLSDVGGITLRATGLASADAINLEAPAGGIDVDAALQINITSSQDATDAIRLFASAGGLDIDAVGAAGQDITITNTGGSIKLDTTEAIADAIVILATGGGIDITSTGAALDIDVLATGGSVNITATEAAANAIVLSASNAAGGIDITTGGGSVDISSAGFVTVVANTASVASPTAASTQNFNVGAATFTGFSTAAAASQVFTITNSIVTTASVIHVTVSNEGANDAQMTVMRVKRLAGSFEVTTKNNGAAALNGNVTVSWWILQA